MYVIEEATCERNAYGHIRLIVPNRYVKEFSGTIDILQSDLDLDKGKTYRITFEEIAPTRGNPMTDCNFAYPTAEDFEDAVSNVIATLGGDESDLACTAHCAWVVQGYIQGVLLPHTHEGVKGAAPVTTCKTKADAKAALESLRDAKKTGMQAAGFDWYSLLTILLPVILEWLKPKSE